MSELIPALGCLTLLILGLPVWALVEARRARRRSELFENRIEDFSSRLKSIEARMLELKREIRVGAPAPEPQPEPLRPPVPPEPMPVVPERVETLEPPRAAEPPAPPPPLAAPPPELAPAPVFTAARPETAPRPFDWESLISVRAFAWLGGAALFLGAVLFLQYAIQHGLISPAMRVAIGLLVGSAAVVWGDSLRVRSLWAGQATSGAGVAILYASFFAAHARYHLLGTTATFAAMGLVTVVAGILAVRRESFILAVLGTAGGFLTPYLLSTREDRPIGLLLYVLALDVGVLYVARKRAWFSLSLLGLAGSAFLYMGWAARHLDSVKLPYAMAAAILLSGLFVFGLHLRDAAGVSPEATEQGRIARVLAALAPFLVALATAGDRKLALSPAILVAFLLVLIAQVSFVARRPDSEPIVPAAAALAMLSLVFRAGSDLFPARRVETLLLFSLVTIALFLVWLLRRESRVLLLGATIGLIGTWVVVARVVDVEPKLHAVLPLWLYAGVGAAGLLAIGTIVLSGFWICAAQVFLLFTLMLLGARFLTSRLAEYLPLVLIPGVIFWVLPFLSARWRPDRPAWISAGIAPAAAFVALYVFAKPVWGTETLGLLSIGLGALAFVALRRALTLESGDPRERRFTAAVFGALTLLFATAAIPILLDKEWITVAWALEAAALAWLSTRLGEPGLVRASAALGGAVFARLVMNPLLWSYHPRTETPIFNWYLYTFGIPAIALLAAAHWLRNDPTETAKELRAPELLRVFAGVILFVLLNVEIADFYSTGPALTFRPAGGGLAQDMTYSLAWGLFALGVLAIGISRKSKPSRAAALVVLLLTVGKVFLHDLWSLGALYRVGSIVGLAVALLAVSFLTQRYVFSRAEP